MHAEQCYLLRSIHNYALFVSVVYCNCGICEKEINVYVCADCRLGLEEMDTVQIHVSQE